MEGDLETVVPYQFEPVASDSSVESDTEADDGSGDEDSAGQEERPLGQDKWAWHRKSRGERAEPFGHFAYVGRCNQRRTRVRVKALKQGWVGLALLMLRDNFSTFEPLV